MIRKILLGLLGLLVVVVAGVAGWLIVAPPELLRIADGYAAKIICSNVFLAHRDPTDVLNVDVQVSGNPALKLIRASVDRDGGTVTAGILGLFARATAIDRPGLGCTLAPDGKVDALRASGLAQVPAVAPETEQPWPEGNGPTVSDPAITKILEDPALAGPGMRAIVVAKDGKLLAERYGAGFDVNTPLLGWSMSKSINAILLGMVMKSGKLSLDDSGLFPQWQGDGRKDITLRDLLDMTSGLAFNEDYGDVTDVTHMLFIEPDMSGYAAARPLIHPPGTTFSYSTGTAMMVSRVWAGRLPDAQTALAYPRTALFDPLGMTSAVAEPDEGGTIAGGSYMYATARDWAKVGQFLLDGGVWHGQNLLPDGFVQMMQTSNGKPGGYSELQTWLTGPTEDDGKTYGLPKGTYWFIGHDGQSMAVIPSAKMVVVRMGLTNSDLGWGPEPMIKAILAAVGAPA